MSDSSKAIDKFTFKVNVPQLVSIIVGAVTIYAAFSSVKTDIQLLSLKLEQHTIEQVQLAKNITDIQTDQKSQDNRISDIDKRVYKLEKNQY